MEYYVWQKVAQRLDGNPSEWELISDGYRDAQDALMAAARLSKANGAVMHYCVRPKGSRPGE
jgi:hypothetical protein